MPAKKFGSAKFKDITGQQFGKLLVLSESGRDRHGNVTWKCKCDCGVEGVFTGSSMRLGRSRSCGCSVTEFRRAAYAAVRAKTGKRGTGFRQLVNYYKVDARRRGLDWKLSDDLFAEMTHRPCFYCGTEPHLVCRPDMTPWTYNGIDRVDNCRGYDPDNVVTCCKVCNEMKMTRTVDQFLAHVDAIHRHSIRPQSLV